MSDEALERRVRGFARLLEESGAAEREFLRWPDINQSFEGEVELLLAWMKRRTRFLDSAFTDLVALGPPVVTLASRLVRLADSDRHLCLFLFLRHGNSHVHGALLEANAARARWSRQRLQGLAFVLP